MLPIIQIKAVFVNGGKQVKLLNILTKQEIVFDVQGKPYISGLLGQCFEYFVMVAEITPPMYSHNILDNNVSILFYWDQETVEHLCSVGLWE